MRSLVAADQRQCRLEQGERHEAVLRRAGAPRLSPQHGPVSITGRVAGRPSVAVAVAVDATRRPTFGDRTLVPLSPLRSGWRAATVARASVPSPVGYPAGHPNKYLAPRYSDLDARRGNAGEPVNPSHRWTCSVTSPLVRGTPSGIRRHLAPPRRRP